MVAKFKAYSGAMPTTGLTAGVAGVTGVKTLLQLAPPSGRRLFARAWGVSFDSAASAAGVKCELVETDVAATVVAHTSTGLVALNADGLSTPSALTLGTAATGYTASAEGSVTATRVFDLQYVNPAGGYSWSWMLGDEALVVPTKFLRVRISAPASVNVNAWIQWEE